MIQNCNKIDLLKNKSSFGVTVEEILGPECYLQIDIYVISFDACLSPWRRGTIFGYDVCQFSPNLYSLPGTFIFRQKRNFFKLKYNISRKLNHIITVIYKYELQGLGALTFAMCKGLSNWLSGIIGQISQKLLLRLKRNFRKY